MASAWLGQFDHKHVRPFPHRYTLHIGLVPKERLVERDARRGKHPGVKNPPICASLRGGAGALIALLPASPVGFGTGDEPETPDVAAGSRRSQRRQQRQAAGQSGARSAICPFTGRDEWLAPSLKPDERQE